MHVISRAVEFRKFGLKILAYRSENNAQGLQGLRVEYLAPVTGYKDQMYMKLKNHVATGAKRLTCVHRPITFRLWCSFSATGSRIPPVCLHWPARSMSSGTTAATCRTKRGAGADAGRAL